MISDGWYLMNTAQLETLLESWRAGDERLPDGVSALTVEDALRIRNEGNLPDDADRSLRLVLRIESAEQLASLERRRAGFEPDYHEQPSWRRAGSRPVNVVPLRRAEVKGLDRAWWEESEVAALEEEWQRSGTIAGVDVPGEYRSFVYKTVLALRRAGKEVTAASITDSIERWVTPEDATKIRRALNDP